MVLILVLTAACGDLPVIKELLYPFAMFKTMIHESGHALMARLTGGHVSAIALNPTPDAYGVTLTRGGNAILITLSGYLGLAVFGALLIWWGRKPKEARFTLQSIGIAMLAITLFYGSGTMTNFLMMLLVATALLAIASVASEHFCHFFLIFLAVQTSLDAMISLKDMVLASAMAGGSGDSKALEELTGLPSLFWTVSWSLLSLSLFVLSFWLSYRKPSDKSDQAVAPSVVITPHEQGPEGFADPNSP